MILLTKIESSLVFIKKEEADMNKQLGQIITAAISEITEKAVFAQKNGQTYQVTSEVEKQVGEEVTGLAYLDQNDRLSLAIDIPIAEDRYDWAEVVNVQRDLVSSLISDYRIKILSYREITCQILDNCGPKQAIACM